VSSWVPLALSGFLSFSRSPLGLITLLNSFPAEAAKDMKEELRKICWDTVYRIRESMLSGEIGPPNTDGVEKAKGKNTPTYDTGDLAMALKVRVIKTSKENGIAYFVGVPDNAGFGSHHPGAATTKFWKQPLRNHQQKTLYQLSAMMISGFDIIHPKSKQKIGHVPSRNFLEKGFEYAEREFGVKMNGAMVSYTDRFRRM